MSDANVKIVLFVGAAVIAILGVVAYAQQATSSPGLTGTLWSSTLTSNLHGVEAL